MQQVFYVEDPIEKMVHYVIKKILRKWCNNGNLDTREEDVKIPQLNDTDFVCAIETQVAKESWFRDNIPVTRVPIQDN